MSRWFKPHSDLSPSGQVDLIESFAFVFDIVAHVRVVSGWAVNDLLTFVLVVNVILLGSVMTEMCGDN